MSFCILYEGINHELGVKAMPANGGIDGKSKEKDDHTILYSSSEPPEATLSAAAGFEATIFLGFSLASRRFSCNNQRL